MDLRSYYRKIREVEAGLPREHSIVVNLATPDGGRPGVMTETPRHVAARLIAEGKSRVATEQEAREYQESVRQAKERYEQEEASRRIQVMIIPSQDLKKKDRSQA